MTNDNDSDADLDLDLSDEFNFENSEPNLSFDDPTDKPESSSEQTSDDSIELNELFGDSNDDFNFSKKEEINLNLNDVDEPVIAESRSPDIDAFDLQQAGEAVSDATGMEVESDAIVETINDAVSVTSDVAEETADSELNAVNAAAAPTAAAAGGIFAKILGLFSRKNPSDEYGADYAEFHHDDASPKGDAESPLAVESIEPRDESFDDGDTVSSAIQDDESLGSSDSFDLEFDDDHTSGEASSENVAEDVNVATGAVDDDALSQSEIFAEDSTEFHSDATVSGVGSDAIEKIGDIGAPAATAALAGAAATGGLLARFIGIFKRPPKVDKPIAEHPTDEIQAGPVVSDAVDQPVDVTQVEATAEEISAATDSGMDFDAQFQGESAAIDDESGEFVFDNAAKTVTADDTIASPSVAAFDDEFDFETIREKTIANDSELHSEPVSEVKEPAQDELDLPDELELSEDFDLNDEFPTTVAGATIAPPEDIEVEPLMGSEQNSDNEDPIAAPAVADPTIQNDDAEFETPANAETDSIQLQELEQLRRENGELKVQLETAHESHQQTEESFEATRSEISELMIQRDSLGTELQKVESQQQSLQIELEETRKALAAAEEEKASLPGSAALAAAGAVGGLAVGSAASESKADLSKFQQQLENEKQLRKDAEQYLEEAEEQRNDVAQVLSQTRSQLKELQESQLAAAASNEANEKIEEITQRVDSLSQERDQLQSNLDQTHADNTQIQNKFDELEKQYVDLEDEVATARTTTEKFDAERLDLINRSTIAEAEINRLKSDIESSTNAVAASGAMIEEAQSGLSKLEATNAQLQAKLEENTTELATKTASIEAMQSELGTANQKLAEAASNSKLVTELKHAHSALATLESKLSSVDLALKQKETEVESLRSEVGTAKEMSAKLESDLAHTSRLHAEVEGLKSEKQELEDRANSRDSEISQLKSALQSAKDHTAEIQIKLHAVKNRKEQLAHALEEKSAAANQLTALRSELDGSRLEVEKVKQQLAVETTGFQSRLAAEQQLVSSRKGEVERLTAELDRTMNRLNENQKLLEQERAAKAQLSNELESQRGSIKMLNAKLEAADAMSNVNTQLQEAMQRQEQRIGELDIKNDRALQRIEALIAAQPKATSKPRNARSSSAASTRATKSDNSSKDGEGDKLTMMNGIGPVLQKRLGGLGITTFEQIAAWTQSDIREWEAKLEWGSITKDEWVKQAQKLID